LQNNNYFFNIARIFFSVGGQLFFIVGELGVSFFLNQKEKIGKEYHLSIRQISRQKRRAVRRQKERRSLSSLDEQFLGCGAGGGGDTQ
jgi:hypothetical protein